MYEHVEERKAQAAEILSQLGGRQFVAMTGAKYITYDGTAPTANLSLKFQGSPVATHLKIVLDGMDTYTVTFLKVRGNDCRTVKEFTGVYNDMLQSIFTETTGLHTTLGTCGR